MRVFFVVIVLLTMVLIYLLVAGGNLYTLESENSEYNDVITWVKKQNNPLPVTKARISAKQNSINLEDATHFYSINDRGFGTIQLSGNRLDPVLNINWYNLEGKPAGNREESWQHDAPLPVLRIDHASGNLVCIDLQNRIRIINPQGQVLNEFQILDSYQFHSENNAYVDLNNSLLSVAVTEILSSLDGSTKYKSSLRVFNLDGKVRMRFDLDEWRIRSLTGSVDGFMVAASFYRKKSGNPSYQFRTIVFNLEGNILLDQPVNCRRAFFNQKNDRLFLMNKDIGYLMDIISKSKIAEVKVKKQGNLYLSAVFMPPSGFLALQEGNAKPDQSGGRTSWIYDNIRIISLDNSGKEIDDLPVENITINKPAFWYNEESEKLFVGHRKGWKIYKVKL